MAFSNLIQPKANLRDIVKVEGYDDLVFKVVAVNHLLAYEDFIEVEEVMYDLICENTSAFNTAYDEDITIVRRFSGTTQEKEAPPETVDDLLIELSDYVTLEKMFGECEEYTKKKDGIKERIRKISEVN